jgi:hypothetical protein
MHKQLVTCRTPSPLQVRAIMHAAANAQRSGCKVLPHIMVPLIGGYQEFKNQATIIKAVAKEVLAQEGVDVVYKVGTMIETPRAALLAAELAEEADFFSFGTNDLTQMTYGISRDDIGKFLPMYLREKIYPHDPFQVRVPTPSTCFVSLSFQLLRVHVLGLNDGLILLSSIPTAGLGPVQLHQFLPLHRGHIRCWQTVEARSEQSVYRCSTRKALASSSRWRLKMAVKCALT